ncbi:MAG: hypothetical protein IMW99_06860, partial [Firmicutes bacterium]|nr:hypothetical protein [Bacillota bacterium]
MIQVGFKPYYRVLHFTSEIGGYIVGGIASFMNELYRYHPPDVGFVHLYDPRATPDLALDLYPGWEDILAVSYAEAYRIKELS